MGNTSYMKVPYYILVNDEDKSNPKFYHECSYGKTPYEIVYGDESTNTFFFGGNTKRWVSIGPRRMRYVETAMKFRNKIADEKGISTDHLKIVRVYRSQKETFKKIKNGELEEINFESVWE